MEITILGMGKTGHSISCYLLNKGYNVVCWDRDERKLELLQKGIDCTGVIEGHFTPKIERDISKAISGANCILVNTVASGHRDIATLLKDKLNEGQLILIFNSNWGILEFSQILEEELIQKNITLAETGGMHIMTDLPNLGHCHIKKIKKSLSLSCYPLNKQTEILSILLPMFPQLFPSESPVITSMDTSNPILHAPIVLGEFSKIEEGADYYFYREGATPLIVKYIEKLDVERLSVMKAIGIRGSSCLDIVNRAWNTNCKNLYDAIHTNYANSKGPKSVEYRFITEDVPFGIVPIVKLGQVFGVKTPYANLLVNMYSALLERDFMLIGPYFKKEDVLHLL